MALDNKLKSEMASGATYSDQSRTTPIPERTTSRPVFESYSQGSQTEEEKVPPKVAYHNRLVAKEHMT